MKTQKWNKVLEQLTEIWEQLASIFKEVDKSFDDLIDSLKEEEQKKLVMTPSQYGMSLLDRNNFDRHSRPSRENYMPAAPKNRPYQRRRF